MNFGAHLKHLRRQTKLAQDELARKCRLSGAYINRLEAGKADPPTRQVCVALARALGVESDELWRISFTARLETWLRKEGLKNLPNEFIATLFDQLVQKK
ncbi:MAG: helix-turn-helix domain-containing protein [Terriglobia bacterium]